MLPANTTADSRLSSSGPYAFGEVEFDEGCTTNVVIYGINKKKRKILRERIANGEKVGVHKRIVDLGGYKGLHFELDEGE